ncbi:MAG TPA: M48 family metalloprotease [Methylotenera sp.]|nr:M48 family metalloprotease [Methylotenera sp.]
MLRQRLSFKKLSVVFLTSLTLLITSCGVNPVTKKREIQLVSESQEISIGKQNYGPARQSQGGDYEIDQELTAYVQSIGNKLAAVSDRKLPYEFIIINDSVPNAWAMPGGKIAFNRGLLYELNNEAELAAVMGHEMVHAAARHGAKSMERGIFMQGAMIAVGMATQDNNYSNLIVGGAQLGSQLATSKYGRDAESEADLYGMQYMKKAGYDPAAAVTLQETFVRLSAGKNSNFIEGLFASHPPSQIRVDANKATLAQLGAGGEPGKDIYAQKVAKLKSTQGAYKAYDEAVKLLSEKNAGEKAPSGKNIQKATTLAKQAIAGEPREARFQELLGDIAMVQKKPAEALPYYDKAIALQPDYFKPHVQAGIALFNLGRKAEAEKYLTKSNALLPTAPSHFLLGKMAEERGDLNSALKNYEVAASSNSEIGKQSIAEYTRLDLPQHPAKYLQSGVQADNLGNIYAVVQNPTSATIGRVQVRIIQYDAKTGRALGQSQPLYISSAIAPNKRGQVQVFGVRVKTQQELQLYKVVVERAELAN